MNNNNYCTFVNEIYFYEKCQVNISKPKMKIIIKRFKSMIKFYQSVMPMKLNPSMKYNLVPTWL